jgi:hypothetical protein
MLATSDRALVVRTLHGQDVAVLVEADGRGDLTCQLTLGTLDRDAVLVVDGDGDP